MLVFSEAAINYQVTRIKFFIGWCLVVFVLSCPQLNAQFPLRISNDGKFFVTKQGSPFLVNGRVADIYHNFPSEMSNLQRYPYLGLNAACVFLPENNLPVNPNGKLPKSLKKDIKTLKRFIREAVLYKVAVFVIPAPIGFSNQEDTMALGYADAWFHALRHKKNVSWLLRPGMEQLMKRNKIKAQLPGILSRGGEYPANPDVGFVASANPMDTARPFILFLEPSSISDSTATAVRRKAYTAMLSGASGIITHQAITKPASLYNPVAYQLRQLKSVFDSLPWPGLKTFPQITNPQVSPQKVIASVNIDKLLAVVYINTPFTLPLHLKMFNSKVKFSWINPITGKEFKTTVDPHPPSQLFLPPFDEGKYTDWLLVIKPLQEHSLQ